MSDFQFATFTKSDRGEFGTLLFRTMKVGSAEKCTDGLYLRANCRKPLTLEDCVVDALRKMVKDAENQYAKFAEALKAAEHARAKGRQA